MEVCNIHTNAKWFSSYMNSGDGSSDAQGHALVEAQIKKIEQLTNIIKNIKTELKISATDPGFALNAIKYLINDIKEIEAIDGHFKWIG